MNRSTKAKVIFPLYARLFYKVFMGGLININQFKSINDNFGHHEGDFALKQFANVMRSMFQENDVIGRLGGDEFVATLTDANDERIAIILKRFKTEMDTVNKTINKPYLIEYSVGVASFSPGTEKSLEEMVAEADAPMYEKRKAYHVRARVQTIQIIELLYKNEH